ncbi:MAG: serine/threonine-protein kinase [Acidobacteria bacterium]|nr:serine/threonine-protein kinase [Acidobacteriota bacterium]
MLGLMLRHFHILEKLGEGGMGTVYKAHDTKLDRLVAVKVLNGDSLQDKERKQRFLQEARAASSLQHPHIVTVFEIETDVIPAHIVMEYVDGAPLSARIRAQGMELAECMRIGTQVADALAAAHAARVVHRDIKPSNILVTAAGQAKVLDFGLAKLMEGPRPGPDEATRLAQAQTGVGVILGSVPYMSPEQAQGQPVDARSDIFSFGAVLYEMVSGKRPFAAETVVGTLAAIVAREPAELKGAPPALAALIGKCLRKDVAQRPQSMAEVKQALEEMREQPVPRFVMRRIWVVAAAVGAIGILSGALFLTREPKPAARAPGEVARMWRVTPRDGQNYASASISRDGKFVAYLSDRGGPKGRPQLWVQTVNGGNPLQLTKGPGSPGSHVFSSDGTEIYYAALRDDAPVIEAVPVLGGSPRVLAKGTYVGFTVSPDGKHLAATRWGQERSLVVITLADGSVRQVAGDLYPDRVARKSHWVDDGHLLLEGKRSRESGDAVPEWFVIPVAGGAPVALDAPEFLRKQGKDIQRCLIQAVGNGQVYVLEREGDQSIIWAVRLVEGKLSGSLQRVATTNGGLSMEGVSAKAGVATMTDYQADLYHLPVDMKSGEITGPVRRLTADNRPKNWVGMSGPDDSFLFRVADGTQGQYILRSIATGEERVVAAMQVGRSRNGKYLIRTVPDGALHQVQVAPIERPTEWKTVCRSCGHSGGNDADFRWIEIIPESESEPMGKAKVRTQRLELESGKVREWLSHPELSVINSYPFGERGDWMIITAMKPGVPIRIHFLAPMGEQPAPHTEWIRLPERASFFLAGGSNLLFHLGSDGMLRSMRFDPVRRKLEEPKARSIWQGAAPVMVFASDGEAAGIVFVGGEARSSVWLAQLPQ